MNYAEIVEGVVVNVLSIHPEQADEFPDCVPVVDILVEIGDTYENGKFFRNGVEIKSTAQQLAEANDIINILLGGETV